MTDPGLADATYIEPIVPEIVERILEKEKPDALLPTMGGQTALNTALALAESGALERHGVELIGANREAIAKAEDRLQFREAMARIGLESPKSALAGSLDEAQDALEAIGLPVIIRPSYTLGGTGGGVAYNRSEFRDIVSGGLRASPVGQVLIEESSWAGRSSRWRSSATRRTTASSCAPSRMSIRWASTPATASRSRRRSR